MEGARRAREVAGTVLAAFDYYHAQFLALTRRVATRYEHLDWPGIQWDAHERLDLHSRVVTRTVATVRELLGPDERDRPVWADAKRCYAEQIAQRADGEVAETFFNSVVRRILDIVGADPAVEFSADGEGKPPAPAAPVFTTYAVEGPVADVVRKILGARRIGGRPVDFDAASIADEIDAHWRAASDDAPLEAIDLLDAVFYRNKGAYLIGRIRGAGRVIPLLVALVSDGPRVVVDAVLTTEDEASIVFSFTRSYFHVDVPAPYDTIRFLKSLMPMKRVAELYIALGYDKHGKTELYRDLMRHLARSSDFFDVAPGDAGMVMSVFTMPSYDVVFKVIRDEFAPPKTVSRRHVIDRYQLVFRHDRAGRLVDAQEFEHLAIPRDRFSPALLRELTGTAAETVSVDGDRVLIKHCYIERRVRPLNLFLREADGDDARAVVLDYGRAIKDLAATNIFPGDLLLKNFGVTRHGRVIFYDYDELTLLTDCNFRKMPEPRTYEEEIADEPWFSVAPGDIFPEEFLRFIGFTGELNDVFADAHGDLLAPDFWKRMQAVHRNGDIVDIFPYPDTRRLGARSAPAP